jgi:hypothetical protein
MSDVKPLPPDLQALLDAERDAPGAPAGSRDRVRNRLAVSIGASVVGAAGAAHATPPLGTSALPTASKLLLAKIGLGLVAIVGVSAGIYTAARPKHTAAPIPPGVAEGTFSKPSKPAHPERSAEGTESKGQIPEETAQPIQIQPVKHPHRRPIEAKSTAPVAPPAAENELAAERALLDDARQSLATGHPDHALTALERHASKHPAGQLAEERDALRIRALAAAGRADDARRRAGEFKKAHPRSIFLPAVDATLRTLP